MKLLEVEVKKRRRSENLILGYSHLFLQTTSLFSLYFALHHFVEVAITPTEWLSRVTEWLVWPGGGGGGECSLLFMSSCLLDVVRRVERIKLRD